MKLGIGSYTLTWSIGVPGYPAPANPLDATELIRLAAKAGVRLVQLADNIPLGTMTDAELQSIRAASREYGVELELGTRGTDPDHLLHYLDLCEFFQARLLRTIITVEDLGRAKKDIALVLPQFEKQGVIIGVENHSMHKTGELAAMIRQLDHPCLGSCLDTVNSFSALETPDIVVENLAPFVVNFHIKDFDIRRVDHQMGFEIVGTPAGSGRLDIGSILAKIRMLGRAPTCILELWTPYQGEMETTIGLEQRWTEKSLAYLKPLFH